MSLSQVGVESKSLLNSGPRLFRALEMRDDVVRLCDCIRQAGVCKCIIRIEVYSLLKIPDRFAHISDPTFVPEKTSLQIEPISFGICGVVLFRELLRIGLVQFTAKLLRNVLCDLVLQCHK